MKKDDIYAIGLPAKKAYGPFITFVSENVDPGDLIMDLGGGEGAYSEELTRRGFKCVNVDLNKKYLSVSRARDIESCAMDASSLGFKDKSFDIVLLFETIEHIANCDGVLEEAGRVARKRILITVPNSGGYRLLKDQSLTYDHFLAMDHVNFFCKEDLEDLLSRHFENFQVIEMEPTVIKADPDFIPSRLLRKSIQFLMKLKLTGPKVRFGLGVYNRLYGIVDVA